MAVLLAVSASGFSAAKSYDLETKKYDDETQAYVYAHTQRSLLDFVRLVESHADALGSGKDAGIAVFAPENWPLAWYLRDYTKTGYWGEFKTDVDVDMYIGSVAQDPPLATKLGDAFERFGPYNMRGVVDLVLYVRRTTPRPSG